MPSVWSPDLSGDPLGAHPPGERVVGGGPTALLGWVCFFVLHGDKVYDALAVCDDDCRRGRGGGWRRWRFELVVGRWEVGQPRVVRGRGKGVDSRLGRLHHRGGRSSPLLDLLLYLFLKLLVSQLLLRRGMLHWRLFWGRG